MTELLELEPRETDAEELDVETAFSGMADAAGTTASVRTAAVTTSATRCRDRHPLVVPDRSALGATRVRTDGDTATRHHSTTKEGRSR